MSYSVVTIQIRPPRDIPNVEIPRDPSVTVSGVTYWGRSIWIVSFAPAQTGVNYAGANTPGVAF